MSGKRSKNDSSCKCCARKNGTDEASLRMQKIIKCLKDLEKCQCDRKSPVHLSESRFRPTIFKICDHGSKKDKEPTCNSSNKSRTYGEKDRRRESSKNEDAMLAEESNASKNIYCKTPQPLKTVKTNQTKIFRADSSIDLTGQTAKSKEDSNRVNLILSSENARARLELCVDGNKINISEDMVVNVNLYIEDTKKDGQTKESIKLTIEDMKLRVDSNEVVKNHEKKQEDKSEDAVLNNKKQEQQNSALKLKELKEAKIKTVEPKVKPASKFGPTRNPARGPNWFMKEDNLLKHKIKMFESKIPRFNCRKSEDCLCSVSKTCNVYCHDTTNFAPCACPLQRSIEREDSISQCDQSDYVDTVYCSGDEE